MPDVADIPLNITIHHFIFVTFVFGTAAGQFCFLASWSGLFSPGTWLMPAAHIYFYLPFCLGLAEGRNGKLDPSRLLVWWIINFFSIEAAWLMNGIFWEHQQLWFGTPLFVALTMFLALVKYKLNNMMNQPPRGEVLIPQEVNAEDDEPPLVAVQSTGTTTQSETGEASFRTPVQIDNAAG